MQPPQKSSNSQEGPSGFGAEEFREFLLRACHDLRTPVRSLRTGAELLLQAPEKRQGGDLEQILGFMIDNAKRIDSLVDGLSGLSLALGTYKSSFQPTRIEVVIRSVVARMAKTLSDGDAQVNYSDLPTVWADPDRLAQLFENLIRNAIQNRGTSPPLINISTALKDGAWLIAVRDNGVGVEAGYLERIFRPFERLSGPSAGPGLGLAICREIVVRHGGKIWAESDAGSGATFYLTLPADEGSLTPPLHSPPKP